MSPGTQIIYQMKQSEKNKIIPWSNYSQSGSTITLGLHKSKTLDTTKLDHPELYKILHKT